MVVGTHLPGFRKPLDPIAMVKIFIALLALATSSHHPPPLTAEEEVAKVAVIALCWSAVDQHLAGRHVRQCPSGTGHDRLEFGIQCLCTSPSLTYDIWINTVRAPSVIFVASIQDVQYVTCILAALFGSSRGYESLMSAAILSETGLSAGNLIPGRTRPLLAADFLARVGLVGKDQSNIPDSSTLSHLRTQMQVDPLSHPSSSTSPDKTHLQERLILVTALSSSTRSTLDKVFSEPTSVWIPGQNQQPKVMVNGKLQGMTIGYVGQFPHGDEGNVLKELIGYIYEPQHMERGTVMFRDLDEWVKRV